LKQKEVAKKLSIPKGTIRLVSRL